MTRADRSLSGAHNGLRDAARIADAVATLPRLASVRALCVLQQERNARRQRNARACVALLAVIAGAALALSIR